ncbi:hypothetical protein ADIS_2365 [Lunatimonas lonarensis]|uniref:Bacterial Pleckstrin homology domain-containing protein n=1 Tax=Lunatimonas lonarensis TaxID=1232681 RepID=R7ZSQ6_9BACT|nr:hypothetical protein [Lunatimonas lonarensis]EON77155.1 hypothetical protein ADIS_2365 [Lunatimonas lonarensis]
MSKTIFKETQKFREVWIWLIMLLSATLITWLFVQSATSPNTSAWDGIIALIVLVAVTVLLYVMELEVRLDDKKLSFSYFPFIGVRTYPLEQIESLTLIRYNSLLKFGGWGIRYNFHYWVYNTGGNHGILVKTSKKTFLLGTQQPEAAAMAVEWFNQHKLNHHAN